MITEIRKWLSKWREGERTARLLERDFKGTLRARNALRFVSDGGFMEV